MSISLSYLSDLSRVRIQAADLPVDVVRVERSQNGMLWETVRGGRALPVSAGAIQLDDYEFMPDVENFYRLVDIEEDSPESSPSESSPSESSPSESSPGDDVLESDSTTPDLGGQIWLKSIRYPFLNRPVTVTDWSEITRGGRGGVFEVSGRSLPVTVTDIRESRAFTLEVMTGTLELARDMDLILAAGQIMLVHVPAGCPVPGGYVHISEISEERRSTRGVRRYWPLRCRITAPPAPDVVATTLTWATVRRLYGSWEAIRQSNPTWGDLLATVASPDDLVVL